MWGGLMRGFCWEMSEVGEQGICLGPSPFTGEGLGRG